MNNQTYRKFLRDEFENRRARNPLYSQNAYARDIGMAPPKLTQALNGTCGLSPLKAQGIADRLKFDKKEKELFVTLVEAEHARSKVAREAAREKLDTILAKQQSEISLDQFKVIKDWYHFGIINLLSTSCKSKHDVAWLAMKLEVSEDEVSKGIARLLSVGMIKEADDGAYVVTEENIITTSDIPSRALREHHRQYLQKAHLALDKFETDLREFMALMFVCDESDIAEMKTFIRETIAKFDCKFSRDQQKSVFALHVQLYPISLEREPPETPKGS